MRRFMKLISTVALIVICISGCGKQMEYGGVEGNGHGAVEKICEYYDLLNNESPSEIDNLFTDNYIQQKLDVAGQNVSLVQLVSCEVLEEDEIREQDKEWMKKHKKEFYSCCFVRTSDVVLCEEDGMYGVRGDEVSRELCYILVMENKESEWKIEDYGYPWHEFSEKPLYQKESEKGLADGEIRKYVTLEKVAYTIGDGKGYSQEIKMSIPISYIYNEEKGEAVRIECIYQPEMFLVGTNLENVDYDCGEYAVEVQQSGIIWVYTNCSWSYTDIKNQIEVGRDVERVSSTLGGKKVCTKVIRVGTEIQLSDLQKEL